MDPAMRAFVESILGDPGAFPPTQRFPKSPEDGDIPVWDANQKQWVRNKRISTSHLTPNYLADALATSVLRAEASNTAVGGQAAGSFLMVNGTPRTPGTLANALVPAFTYDASIDDPPVGYKTQWNLQVQYETNAVGPGGTHTMALWEFTAVGGGAGGYTQTGAGAFTTPTQVVFVNPGANLAGVSNSGWHSHGVTGDIVSGKTYGFGVNYSAVLVASSAIQVNSRLYRRFVPA